MTRAIELSGEPSEVEVKRELLRLRFAVSRLRMHTALASLQGDALHSAPARAMAWVRAPWVRRIAIVVSVGLLVGVLWRFGWRRPVRLIAQGLSMWQLARPLLHDFGFGVDRPASPVPSSADGAEVSRPYVAAAAREAQPAAP